ncbi:MAG: PorT family protein [Chitinophagaceae bacterium]|nr:PorT family protein [Chitinophagaceae bacterium]
MSDHNFEKQIQQKLDELKIPPADTVWSGVEAQIRKDKRRRRGVIFLPLLFLLIGAGVYFIFQDTVSLRNGSVTKSPSTKTNPNQNSNNSTPENSTPVKDPALKDLQQDNSDNKTERSATKNAQIEPKRKNQTSEIALSSNKVDKNNLNDDKVKASGLKYGSEKQLKKETAGTPNRQTQEKNNFPQANGTDLEVVDRPYTDNSVKKANDKKQQDESAPLIDKQDKTDKQENTTIQVPDSPAGKKMMNSTVENKVADSINSDPVSQVKGTDTALAGNLTLEKKTAEKRTKQSRWKWGLSASAGLSNLMEGGFFNNVLGGEKAMVADVSSNSLNSGAPGPTGIVHSPSAIKKGFSFSIGAFVQTNLSKRLSLSTGIRYNQHSNYIQVGNRVDTGAFLQVQNAFGSRNVTQYYNATPVPVTHKYTNRFHFIELPILLNARLTRSNRLPVSWNAGFSLSYLISANALHFDGNTGVYYKDNGLFNKLQTNFTTGFSLSLWNNSRFPVQIGPQLQYGLTNLMKQEVNASKHLFYFGLNTRIFLKK